MTHCSDDELTLHHYGESPEASAHVAACAVCAERARDLALLLSTIEAEDAVPERGSEYGQDVWARLQPHLRDTDGVIRQFDERRRAGRVSAVTTNATGFVGRPGMRWALAAAAAVTLVATSFVVGRWSSESGSSPTVAGPARAAVAISDPQLAHRVLLLSVADHLERSDRVLTDIMNAPEADITVEQQWADDLIAANRLYRQDAVAASEASVADVLDELERTLLDVVHRPPGAPADLDLIRNRIDSAALLFKVRVLTTELRQRQLVPDASSASSVTPIS